MAPLRCRLGLHRWESVASIIGPYTSGRPYTSGSVDTIDANTLFMAAVKAMAMTCMRCRLLRYESYRPGGA